jgi:hypothetical protein
MKKTLYLIGDIGLFNLSIMAQPGWVDMGGNFAADNGEPKIAVSGDTTFVSYYNPATQKVDLKKFNGTSWVTLGSYTSKSGVHDIEIDYDGSVLLATVRAINNGDNTAEEFYLQLHRYNEGATTLFTDEFIVWNPICTGCQVSNFDFAVNPIGGYGVIFRFNEHFRSAYMCKTGSNDWHTSLVYAQLISSPTTSGIKNAQLIYTDYGATLVSRNENNFGGIIDAMVLHKFEHDLTQSEPLSYEVLANLPVISSPSINLFTHNEKVYITATNATSEAVIYSHQPADGVLTTNSLTEEANLGVEVLEPQLAINNDGEIFIAYVYESGMTYPGKVDKYDANFSNPVTVGGLNYNAQGNIIGLFDLALLNGNPIIAFQYGPPMNKAMVRQFGCVPAPQNYAFNSNSQAISSATSIGGTPSYEWFDCNSGNAISGAMTATFQPTTSGSYAVEITNQGCVTTGNCVTVNLSTAGIREETSVTTRIFPNPTQGIIAIETAGLMQYAVFAVNGQKITHGIVDTFGTVDLSMFEQGIYFLNVFNTTEQSTIKVVLTK